LRAGSGGVGMESEFAAAIGRWQSFQTLIGSAAATLLGLLFVAVSINPAIFRRETHPDYLSIAAKSMGLFVLVLFIALLFQIPEIEPSSMALVLVTMAVLSIVNTVQQLVIMRRIVNEWGVVFFVRRVMLPAAGYGLLLVV